MAKKTFSNPVVNELKGSAWFQRPKEAKETIVLDINSTTPPPASKHKKSTEFPIASKLETQSQKNTVQSVEKTEAVKHTPRSTVRSGQSNEKVTRTQRSSVQHPKKEQTKRRAYDFYPSQLTSLRRIKNTRELSQDRAVSMSEIMREAVDLYLENQELK